ncbi:MAG: hypothetical protein AB1589_45195 [Cyanobacteriota bacterium]
MNLTQQQVEEFASYYNVKSSRMQSVINALIEIGCTSDLLQNALDDVMPKVVSGITPTEAVAQWAEGKQTQSTLATGMDAIGEGMSLVQIDDAEDVRYAAEHRGTAMRVQFHIETADVFLNGPKLSELKEVDDSARSGFRSALRGAAKKNYQVGGKFSSLTRQIAPSSPNSPTTQQLPSAL